MTDTTTAEAAEAPVSVFRSDLPIPAKLERARLELLDMSARNRLLSIPKAGKSATTLEVIDEISLHIYRLLVQEAKAFTFLPGRAAPGTEISDDEDEIPELAQPDADDTDDSGVASRHKDTKLQTKLTPAGLQKRLLDMYHDAKTLEEEQGVNILFLALGTLKWIDPNNIEKERLAPLVLVPVVLERGNAAEKFKLKWRQEEVAPNLSLEAYLYKVHELKMPAFEAGDDFDISAYLAAVAEAVSGKPGWAVNQDNVVLGFFSFAKFLMYRDLDAENWPNNKKLSEHPIIKSLVSDGFEGDVEEIGDNDFIDRHISPQQMTHIVDSDSSQTVAVHEVRAGKSIVIQGPPGTGKSQTIANIIASAVADNKSVLFVAEKMAALEVVKRRLDNTGVGDACLEIHSSKANKRSVLEELRRTWELGGPRGDQSGGLNARLTEIRDLLNRHAERLHQPIGNARFTPYQTVGQLVRLKQEGRAPTDFLLSSPEAWSLNEFHARSALVIELAERVTEIGTPCEHAWRGVGLTTAYPMDVDRLVARIKDLQGRLSQITAECNEFAGGMEQPNLTRLEDLCDLAVLAERLSSAPNLKSAELGADEWHTDYDQIMKVLGVGSLYHSLSQEVNATFNESAWSLATQDLLSAFDPLSASITIHCFDSLIELSDLLPRLIGCSDRLAAAIGRTERSITVAEFENLAKVAERVAVAPNVDASAFAASLWDDGIERLADLALKIEEYQRARGRIGNALSEAAWSSDLGDARRIVAGRGGDFLRFLSGEWRSANRLVRSFLANGKATLEEQIALLDALASGQSAIKDIRVQDDLGRSAFAGEWRSEKSKLEPLLSLIEWMRSLKGLGSEPRILAEKKPDRSRITAVYEEMSSLLDVMRKELTVLWQELPQARLHFFGEVTDLSEIRLQELLAKLLPIRNAHRAYLSAAKSVDPDLQQRRHKLSRLLAAQAASSTLVEQRPLGEKVFGVRWQGTDSDWDSLLSIATWVSSNIDIRLLASRVGTRTELPAQVAPLLAARKKFLYDLSAVLTDLRADDDCALTLRGARGSSIAEMDDCMARWIANSEALSKWVDYRSRAKLADSLGLREVALRLDDGRLPPDAALACFEMSFFEAIFGEQVRTNPELGSFDGDLHGRIVRDFTDLDNQRIKQSALEVVSTHYRGIPPTAGGAVGPLGVLKSEIARKRGHMPIRQLIQKAAPAVQALKPVFMMSPLSVAQFLPPGALTFDLLVMDEASQIQPVDALGAIARCKQVVVVGDPQQLPPTAFFTKMTAGKDGGDSDDGAANVADIESILGLFAARGLPMRMLRWHYRSRHQSLIAVSNRQFYENKLYIVPSPHTSHSGLGLRFHHVPGGIFDTGGTRTNLAEAKVVAQAIIKHAIEAPELSLGVVAFSAAQRRAIQDQLELLRRSLPAGQEAFFQSNSREPFFIKNLENVQGDERDVIFISVGYGPTVLGGRPPMRFGPLGLEGGERRLNVLISRAKRRCDVFSSMTDEDIDPDFASTRKGVFAFKMFMHFARTGRMTLVEQVSRDRDDVFEEQVATALHKRGYQVNRRVGIAGIFIDLAVVDPEQPHRFILGIDCDGSDYASSRSARDRDRLRKSVLEEHGWNIYRLWSIDWFRRPNQQLDMLVSAIEAAKADLASQSSNAVSRKALEIVSVERDDATEMELVVNEPPAAVPYVEAVIVPNYGTELHATATGALAVLVEQVVLAEGPIYIEEIINRLRDAWGLRRAGGRIQEAVERAAELCLRQNRVDRNGEFYSIPGRVPVVRDRSAASSATLRKPEALPPSEMKAALMEVVTSNFGATDDQAIQAVSRLVGFKSTSAQLRESLAFLIEELIKDEKLVRKNGLLELGAASSPRVQREPVKRPIDELVLEGEHERLEFKETLRWDVYQKAINKKLEEVAVKTMAAFANHSGGTLLIGVDDHGVAKGLDADFESLRGDQDVMELHLTNLINMHFNALFRAKNIRVSFPLLKDKLICRIDVERSRTPMYVKVADKNGVVAERFFVRLGNSSHEMPASQIAGFVNERFN